MPVVVRQGNEGRATQISLGAFVRQHTHEQPSAAVTVPPGTVVFDWNGTDLSQFEAAAAFESAGWASTLTIAAETSAQHGNRIRLGSAAGLGPGASIWLATQALPLPSAGTRRRFVFDMTVHQINAQYAGIAFLCEVVAGNLYGLTQVDGVAGWRARIDNGVFVSTGSTVALLRGLGTFSSLQRRILTFTKPAGAPPRGSLGGWTSQVAGGVGGTAWRIDEPAWPAFPAGWNPLTLNRWGLVIQASGGNPAPTAFDIEKIRISAYDV